MTEAPTLADNLNSVKTELNDLSTKGYGSTDIKDIDQNTDIANLPARSAPAARVNPETIGQDKPTQPQTFDEFRASRDLGPDEVKAISDSYAERLKSQTDAINLTFNDKSARQKEANASEDMRTRVLNAKTGNTDSGTGSAAITKTTDKGKAALDAIDHEKEAQIEKAIGQIDDLKLKDIQAESTKKANDLTAYNTQRATNAKSAEDTLKSLATSGVSLEKLQNDKQNPNDPNELSSYDALAKTLGLSPLELDAKYNSLKSAANQIKYTYKVSGNEITAYGVDPTTHELSVKSQQVPGLSSGKWQIKETKDGELYAFDPETKQLTPLSKVDPSTTNNSTSTPAIKPGKTINDGGLKTSEGEIGQANAWLLNGVTIGGVKYAGSKDGTSTDGFADPKLYKLLYDQWRAKGGTVAGFVKNFPPKNYVSPSANAQLPSFLHNSTKSSGG